MLHKYNKKIAARRSINIFFVDEYTPWHVLTYSMSYSVLFIIQNNNDS